MGICPICGEGQLTDLISYQEIKGERIPLLYSLCNYCGSEQASPEQLVINKRIYIQYKKSYSGI